MNKINVKYGDTYGRLTIIKEIEKKGTKRRFLCQCECGNTATPNLSNLKTGHSVSCGCYKREVIKETHTTHGMEGTKIYQVYRSILSRCNRRKDIRYKHYGGRGIKCLWETFKQFYEDMGSTYQEGLTIERNNNDGNYCKENCSWETRTKQARNKSNNIFFKNKCLGEWCEILGKDYRFVYNRIYKLGWNIQDALTIIKIKNNKYGDKIYDQQAIELIESLDN